MQPREAQRSNRTPKRRECSSPRPFADFIQPVKIGGIYARPTQPPSEDDDETTSNIWLVAIRRPNSSDNAEELAFLFAPNNLPPAKNPPETHSILVCLEAAPGSSDEPVQWHPVEYEVSHDLEQFPTVGNMQLLAAVRVGRERPGQSLDRNAQGEMELTLTVQDLCCDDYYVVEPGAPPPWGEWVHAVLGDLWHNSTNSAMMPPMSAPSQIIAGVRSLATTTLSAATGGVWWSLNSTACHYLLIQMSETGHHRGWPLGMPLLDLD